MRCDLQIYADAGEATPFPALHAFYYYGELGGVTRTLALAAIAAAVNVAATATRRMSVERSKVSDSMTPAGAPTHRTWDNFLAAFDHRISGLCNRRSFFRRKELCPVVNCARTHTGVLGFCTWPRPYSGSYILKYVLSEQVIGLNGLRLNGYPHRNSVLMTSHILVRGIPSVSSIQIKFCCF